MPLAWTVLLLLLGAAADFGRPNPADSRQILDAKFISLLHTYVLSQPTAPPPPELITILETPRARLLDLSQQEQTNGTTLLHEAARRKDLRLVELAIRAGADVFCRDRRGRSINDVAGKDDRVKVFLRQCKHRSSLPGFQVAHIVHRHEPQYRAH